MNGFGDFSRRRAGAADAGRCEQGVFGAGGQTHAGAGAADVFRLPGGGRADRGGGGGRGGVSPRGAGQGAGPEALEGNGRGRRAAVFRIQCLT